MSPSTYSDTRHSADTLSASRLAPAPPPPRTLQRRNMGEYLAAAAPSLGGSSGRASEKPPSGAYPSGRRSALHEYRPSPGEKPSEQ